MIIEVCCMGIYDYEEEFGIVWFSGWYVVW